MARKRKRYEDLSSDDIKRAQRRLRSELAKRVDPDTGPKPDWADRFIALSPDVQQQILDEVRSFARVLCPGIHLPGDPLPPLQPDDACAIADDVAAWLGGA